MKNKWGDNLLWIKSGKGKTWKIVIPKSSITDMLKRYHNAMRHFGIKRTTKTLQK